MNNYEPLTILRIKMVSCNNYTFYKMRHFQTDRPYFFSLYTDIGDVYFTSTSSSSNPKDLEEKGLCFIIKIIARLVEFCSCCKTWIPVKCYALAYFTHCIKEQ